MPFFSVSKVEDSKVKISLPKMTLKDDLIKEHKNDKILKYGITRSAWTYVKLKNPNLPRKKKYKGRDLKVGSRNDAVVEGAQIKV